MMPEMNAFPRPQVGGVEARTRLSGRGDTMLKSARALPTQIITCIRERRLPWRYRGGLFNTLVLRRLRRVYYRRVMSRHDPEDVTVVIAVKNRCDYRMINCLRSIRHQDYDQALLNIVLVDYDSDPEYIARYERACDEYGVTYVRVDDRAVWCRGEALNIAIREVTTKYVFSADIDVILQRNYIGTAVGELRRDPLQVILTRVRYCSEGEIVGEIDFDGYDARFNGHPTLPPVNLGPGLSMTFTEFFRAIRGYDEFYKWWGLEDWDVLYRLQLLGLRWADISDKSIILHQWHPKYQGCPNGADFEAIKARNAEYYQRTTSLVRNRAGWGGRS